MCEKGLVYESDESQSLARGSVQWVEALQLGFVFGRFVFVSSASKMVSKRVFLLCVLFVCPVFVIVDPISILARDSAL